METNEYIIMKHKYQISTSKSDMQILNEMLNEARAAERSRVLEEYEYRLHQEIMQVFMQAMVNINQAIFRQLHELKNNENERMIEMAREINKKQEEIIEKAKEKLVEKLINVMGKNEAERMAGIFFSKYVISIDGESVAEWIVNELSK